MKNDDARAQISLHQITNRIDADLAAIEVARQNLRDAAEIDRRKVRNARKVLAQMQINPDNRKVES